MPQSPTVETRIDQAYAAIPVKVSMDELGSVVPPLTGQVFHWLAVASRHDLNLSLNARFRGDLSAERFDCPAQSMLVEVG